MTNRGDLFDRIAEMTDDLPAAPRATSSLRREDSENRGDLHKLIIAFASLPEQAGRGHDRPMDEVGRLALRG
jgi:hypothetical protein